MSGEVDQLVDLLHSYFNQYGYWTLAVALLLENAGIPAPGETVLLFASFLAYSQHDLTLSNIILVGTVSAAAGDNIGYAIGRWGGCALLERYGRFFGIKPETIERAERLFARYGSATVFFARFVFGLRVIAGPLSGVLRMHWKKFAIFNVLGAGTWVVTVSTLGYVFGTQWERLVPLFRNVSLLIGVAVGLTLVVAWWKYRRRART